MNYICDIVSESSSHCKLTALLIQKDTGGEPKEEERGSFDDVRQKKGDMSFVI